MRNRIRKSLAMAALCWVVAAAARGQEEDGPLIATSRWREPATLDDPSRDGWDTEVFNDVAGRRLQALAKVLEAHAPFDAASAAEWATAQFVSAPLRPATRIVRDGGALTVRRADAAALAERPAAEPGPASLAAALRPLAEAFAPYPGVRTKFKIFRIEPAGDQTTTVAYFEISGRSDAGALEVHATWRCRWAARPTDPKPLLAAISLDAYEEATLQGAPSWFADCTEAVIGREPAFRQQLLYGVHHWLDRLEATIGLSHVVRTGMAVGDVDGDGLDDLYVCQPAGLPNRLFRHRPDGTVVDISAEAGVDWLENTASALFLDLDGDGDQDLTLAHRFGILVMENDGTGRFTLRATVGDGADFQSLSAADYDRDGDLDLYVCVDFASRGRKEELGNPVFLYHDARDGGENALWRNDGGWNFTNVTRAVGLGVGNFRHSLAAAWEDYDGDGWPDLYVANDYGPNSLHRNDHGSFRDVAAEAGAEDFGSGMSVSWGDFDRDGRPDLYVGNMWSSAGGRVLYQDKALVSQPEEIRRRLQRFVKGNTLFRNAGQGRFEDVSEASRTAFGRWAWSSVFSDVDNDGWEDLVIANGYQTGEDSKDL